MGLSDALNSLVSSLKGSNSVQQGGGYSNTSSAMNEVAEEAIGNLLANIGKDEESAKSIEEKTNSALEDLMGKLGLSASDAEETLGELKNVFEEEIQERKEAEITEVKETDEEKDIEDKLDDMTDEELEALYEKIADRLEFSPEEAKDYVDGEAEVKARIDEAVKNNPDMDPAEIEAEIRAAYELENPEYAEAKKEAEAVMEKHDKAMDEAYTGYCEENPKPVEEDFDSPAEYAKALNEWSQKAEEHMKEAEKKYIDENENYRNLKGAESLIRILDIDFSKLDLNPADMPTKIITPDQMEIDQPIQIVEQAKEIRLEDIITKMGLTKISPPDQMEIDQAIQIVEQAKEKRLEDIITEMGLTKISPPDQMEID